MFRGREWQSVPIGKCQSQFIYCEGSAGKLYSCGDGMVFDGECKPRETVSECDLCKEGERRPSSSCNEYYECAWKNRALNWQQRKCGSGEAFNDYMKACQKDYTCAAAKTVSATALYFSIIREVFNRTTCIHGSSFAVNCRDYMYCTGERYEMFSCPPNTRWDVHAKTCVMDPTCEMSSYPSPNSCLNGDAVPSADCVTYQICLNSTYYSAPCRDDFGYPAVACSHCFSSADTYPVDQLTFPGQCSSQDRLPHPQDCAAYYTCVGKSWSYRRCEKSGTIYDSVTKTCIQATSWQCSSSTQVQCRHGERIIHRDPSMCDRLTECRHGSWVDLQCPAGYIYGNDAKTFNCVRGQCQGVQQYPQVLPPPQPVAGSPQVAPPASNQNGPVAAQSSIYGVPNFVSPSCHGSLRAPDQYDCSRFWECGSSGTFHSMVEHARLQNVLREASSQQKNVEYIREEYYSMLQCHSGAVRPHQSNQASYMFCQYGVWVERTCPEGEAFDWKTLGCVVAAKPPSYRPKCYEGEMKPVAGQNAVVDDGFEKRALMAISSTMDIACLEIVANKDSPAS
ncbi:hypothetical protein ANCCEY_06810 [Ancylostoma ceylanicum]|uniref:Chitin-binding type-2 domain-containing protein n=1 Tax=Ancylostoma ceylanicum TaxID=53326 RepID=A0A0D6LSA9_9BILA|nr:hypothetical protein ANCCEY_06810 [Ancylostoma ceylanicum]